MGTPSAVITEENIRRVYEIKVVVDKNPVSGAPRVIPVGKIKMEKAGNPQTVHLICGEGSGVDSARRLLLRGFRVTLGVLNIGDTDQKIGKSLGLAMALENPFSPISEEAYRQNMKLIAEASLIVVERFLVGKGNLLNLKAAVEALRLGKRVVVLENDLDYDFTDGEAGKYYQRLREGGAVFTPDHSPILEEVEKAIGAG
jgi:iron complex transport system ATP-binding protein